MRIRWNWGTGIALVYGVFAVATMGFVVFAMDQKVELVSADYYQRALQHDARMAAEANGNAIAEAVRVEAAADARGVRVVWDAARPLPGDGQVTLYRPSDAGADRAVAIAPDAQGRQWIPFGNAPSGHWVVRVEWRAGGKPYLVERAVTVR